MVAGADLILVWVPPIHGCGILLQFFWWSLDQHQPCDTGHINTLRPRQNGRHFPDDIFKCIFLFENGWIWIKISLKFVPKVRINNIPALVQIMAGRRIGDKPLSEPMMVNLMTHIYVTWPQWVNSLAPGEFNNGFKSVIFKINTE